MSLCEESARSLKSRRREKTLLKDSAYDYGLTKYMHVTGYSHDRGCCVARLDDFRNYVLKCFMKERA